MKLSAFLVFLLALAGGCADPSRPDLDPERLRFNAVSTGATHTCGVSFTGDAYCWGENGAGQLGDGTTKSRSNPTRVKGGMSFARVSAGHSHTCGVTTAGTAYCWGKNSYGEVGDGTVAGVGGPGRSSPVSVSGGLTFASVSAGNDHTCGVTTPGAAYCWGQNDAGQFGDGTTTSRSSPAPVTGGLSFASVEAGRVHTCGVTRVGAAYCWGTNSSGQIGDGTSASVATQPVPVPGGYNFTAVSAGNHSTCGITSSGIVYCWGLYDGKSAPKVPVNIGTRRYESVSVGSAHVCAATFTGVAYCWGDNSAGQIGDGTTDFRGVPVLVSGSLTFATIRAGSFNHTCGVSTGGVAWCWGFNQGGKVGDGTMDSKLAPVQIVP